MSDAEWTCKIDEGSAGLIAVTWSPDGRHILNTAQFHVRKTGRVVSQIHRLKHVVKVFYFHLSLNNYLMVYNCFVCHNEFI